MISVDTLVAYAEELEETTEGSGLAWLRARRDEAIVKISGGGSTEYISTTVNGQTFMGKITSTAEDWLDVCQLAVKQMRGLDAKAVTVRIHCAPH